MNLACTGPTFTLATPASAPFAHRDARQTRAKPAFDPAKVGQRAVGREGDPTRVSCTLQADMSDGCRFTPSDLVLGTPQGLQQHAEMTSKAPSLEPADAPMADVKAGMTGKVVVK